MQPVSDLWHRVRQSPCKKLKTADSGTLHCWLPPGLSSFRFLLKWKYRDYSANWVIATQCPRIAVILVTEWKFLHPPPPVSLHLLPLFPWPHLLFFRFWTLINSFLSHTELCTTPYSHPHLHPYSLVHSCLSFVAQFKCHFPRKPSPIPQSQTSVLGALPVSDTRRRSSQLLKGTDPVALFTLA